MLHDKATEKIPRMMLLVQLTKLAPWALMNSTEIVFKKSIEDWLPVPAAAMSSIEGTLLMKNTPTIINMIRTFPIMPKNFIGLRM